MNYFEDGPYDTCDIDSHCNCCEKNSDTLFEVREFFESVVEQLYDDGELDNKLLSFRIEELCHMLKIKLNPNLALRIMRNPYIEKIA